MKNIGKYQGIPCYECNKNEYISVHRRGADDGKQIFIIDGKMVRNNEIIGYYDGNHVKEDYARVVYYAAPVYPVEETRPAAAEEPKAASSFATGTEVEEIKEINFADYSSIVDDFFANLGK